MMLGWAPEEIPHVCSQRAYGHSMESVSGELRRVACSFFFIIADPCHLRHGKEKIIDLWVTLFYTMVRLPGTFTPS